MTSCDSDLWQYGWTFGLQEAIVQQHEAELTFLACKTVSSSSFFLQMCVCLSRLASYKSKSATRIQMDAILRWYHWFSFR